MLVQDFLNGVCTHMIWLTEKKLTYYSGARKSADLFFPWQISSLLAVVLCVAVNHGCKRVNCVSIGFITPVWLP